MIEDSQNSDDEEVEYNYVNYYMPRREFQIGLLNNDNNNPRIIRRRDQINGRVNMEAVMTNFFGEVMRYMDDVDDERIYQATLQESLLHYKTQEKKPNIKIGLEIREYDPEELKHLDDNCSVCFTKYNKYDKIITLTCSHIYHEKCISEWIMYKPECPVCRKDIPVINELGEEEEIGRASCRERV